jgi:hypothetical protein
LCREKGVRGYGGLLLIFWARLHHSGSRVLLISSVLTGENMIQYPDGFGGTFIDSSMNPLGIASWRVRYKIQRRAEWRVVLIPTSALICVGRVQRWCCSCAVGEVFFFRVGEGKGRQEDKLTGATF